MLRYRHLQNCEDTEAYHFAQHVGFHLKEVAKQYGYDPKGIKILSKRQILDNKSGPADAQIVWEEGPTDWVDSISCLYSPEQVCSTINNSYTISFFNI